MERVGDREGKMQRYCSTGQSPQGAVAPTEEEEVNKKCLVSEIRALLNTAELL
jgi:hypothetical protein